MTFAINCAACKGSGVYSGFAEPEGEAVLFYRCEGNGWISAIPFDGRVKRDDIKRVRLSQRERVEFSRNGDGSVTYEEFFAGQMPIDPTD